MRASSSVVLVAFVCAACIVGALGLLAIDPFGLAGPSSGGAARDHRAALERAVADLEGRLRALEAETRQALPQADRDARAAPAAAHDGDPLERQALSELLASLASRVRVLESHVRALSRDPVSRGFAYVAAENEALHRQGIRLLRRLARSDPQALAAIRSLLDDPEGRVRAEALEALEDVRDRESIPRMLELLSDAESNVRDEAIESLTELLEDADASDPQVQMAAMSIAERLADPDRDIRRQAADSLGDFQGQAAVPALLRSLEDSEDEVREQAIDSLADLKATSALPRLRAMYEQEPGEHGVDLAVALRRLGDAEPFQREVSRLSEIAAASVDEQERRRAIRALGRFEATELRPLFERALKDPSRRVREEAEEALEEIDD